MLARVRQIRLMRAVRRIPALLRSHQHPDSRAGNSRGLAATVANEFHGSLASAAALRNSHNATMTFGQLLAFSIALRVAIETSGRGLTQIPAPEPPQTGPMPEALHPFRALA